MRLTPYLLNEGKIPIATLKRRKRHFHLVPLPNGVVAMLRALPGEPSARYFPWHRTTGWRHIASVMQRTGIEGPMACCFGMRHKFGMFSLGHGVPQNLVQRWLDHASAATTAIYLDAVGIEEREFPERMW